MDEASVWVARAQWILTGIVALVSAIATAGPLQATVVQSPTWNSLEGASGLWDGNDNVFYSDNSTLVQRWWSGSAWATTIVDSTSNPPHSSCNAGTTGEISALFVSGYHDVFYVAQNFIGLRHAFFNFGAGVWNCETIESGTIVHPVGVDVAGVPHVFYVDVTRGVLRHAYWAGTNWSKEDIDGLGLSGPGQCNCRVSGETTNRLKQVAATTYQGTQQVYYHTDLRQLRHGFKWGGGAGSWNLETIVGPGANVPGTGLPNAQLLTDGGLLAVTVVGPALHVFVSLGGSNGRELRHIWYSPFMTPSWRLSSQPIIQTSLLSAVSVTAFKGGWALTTRAGVNSFRWGQGDYEIESEYLPSLYLGSMPVWLDSYVGADGFFNAYMTYRDSPRGRSLVEQYWKAP